MSADIWLEDANGEQIIISEDLYAEFRSTIPTRSAASIDMTTFNITYNLSPMLRAAGLPPWKEIVGMTAGDAWPIIAKARAELAADPDKYRAMNPDNGWGTYEDAVTVLSALTAACVAHPQATIGGWL